MSRRGTLLAAVAVGLVASACGRPEKVVITKYFEAVNQQDSVVEEQDTPAPLAELLEAQKKADASVTEHRRKIMDYNIRHTADVDAVKELRKAGKPIPAKLESVGRAWEEFVQKDREVKRAAAEAKARVDAEKQIMTLSMNQFDDTVTGTMHTSAIELELTISGQQQPYLMTLRQYKVQTPAGYKPMSRWIVVSLAPKQ
jgi:hypothetical protein